MKRVTGVVGGYAKDTALVAVESCMSFLKGEEIAAG